MHCLRCTRHFDHCNPKIAKCYGVVQSVSRGAACGSSLRKTQFNTQNLRIFLYANDIWRLEEHSKRLKKFSRTLFTALLVQNAYLIFRAALFRAAVIFLRRK